MCKLSSVLKHFMWAEIKIVLKKCDHITFNQCVRYKVCIAINDKHDFIQKKSNVIALLTHYNSKVDLILVNFCIMIIKSMTMTHLIITICFWHLYKHDTNVSHLNINDLRVLKFWYIIIKIINVLRVSIIVNHC